MIRPIENARTAWRLASVQLAALFAALFAMGPDLIQVWGAMPESLRAALPEGTARWVSSGAFVLVLLGRVFKLAPKAEAPAADTPEDSDGVRP